MRRLSGTAFAALTIVLAGCSAIDGPPPSPTPPGEPAGLSVPIAAAGAIGSPLQVGPLAMTVLSAGAWPEEEQTLGRDVRGIAILVRLASEGTVLELDASDFQLVDTATGARYAAGARPASDDLRLPLSVGAAPVEGILSFTPPRTGTYSLRIALRPDASGTVELGKIRTGIPTAAATRTPAPPPAATDAPAPVSGTGVAGCIAIAGGRWNPIGDDNNPPSLNREYVEIASRCPAATEMGGWLLTDKWRQNALTFPADLVLAAGGTLRVYSGSGTATATKLYFGRTSKEVWGNKAPEMAYLRDASGLTVSTFTPY